MKTESQIQSAVLAYLKTVPLCKAFKIVAANERGCPDIICCISGRFVGFEVKRPGGEVSTIQVAQAWAIMRAGGECFVVRSVAEAKLFIKKLNKRLELSDEHR